MTQNTGRRLTAYAIISAIEMDVRSEISQVCHKSGITDLLPEDVRDNAQKRLDKVANGARPETPYSDFDLLDYSDFGDLSKILHLHNKLWDQNAKKIESLACELEALIQARNNVCHSRPMEPDDFINLYSFAIDIKSQFNPFMWKELQKTINLLSEDPAWIFSISIPKFWAQSIQSIQNNLPIPEFDDTGFIGRREDLSRLFSKILGPHPIMTVVGEGGIGKTALTLKCLYDIAYSKECYQHFDVIIWVTLKTKRLTSLGIQDIKDGIQSALGLTNFALQILGENNENTLENQLKSLLEYMKIFKVLLVIDNLETIGWDDIRDFLAEIPRGSKVIITSRIGLGEYEERIPLGALDLKTSAMILRRAADSAGCQLLKTAPEDMLRKYAESLFCNPLLIKWFTQAVALGKEPNSLIAGPGKDLERAIAFCFENMFEKFSSLERLILINLTAARKPLTQAQLYYLLNEPNRPDYDFALNRLYRSSVLIRTQKGAAIEMHVSDIARDYVSNFCPPDVDTFKQINRKMADLNKMIQNEENRKKLYKFEISAVHVDGADETISASYLRKALNYAFEKEFESAAEMLKLARDIAPRYSEVYRISGFINAIKSDYFIAARDYLAATELAPKSTLTWYNYAYFLYKYLEDYPEALVASEKALDIEPNDLTLKTMHALLLSRSGKWDKACNEYEYIISNLTMVEQRWVVGTLDQACDAYKRLAEMFKERKELSNFKKAAVRGIEIAELGIDEKKPDAGLLEKYQRILEEAMHFCLSENEEEFAKIIISRIEYYLTMAQLRENFNRRLNTFCRRFGFPHAISILTPKEVVPEGFTTGIIDYLPKGQRYGFILGDNSPRLFFHESESKIPWAEIQNGIRVKFKIGENRNGPCAIQVAREAEH